MKPVADETWLEVAIAEAEAAALRGEVPVGAVLVSLEGTEIARNGNRILERKDPTAHAEILVLREGGAELDNERLIGTTLYVTIEPCAMCAGAISLARISRLVYAAADPKGGAVESGPRFFEQETCHHRPQVVRTGDGERAGAVLREFFRARRG
jgi:tRNA(Arg) A34 adenosine deaminase TadA